MKPAKSAINLLPQDDLRRKPLAKFLKWSLTWGRYIIAVTEIILIVLLIIQVVLRTENENLKKGVNNKMAELTGGSALETQIKNAQTRLTSIRTIHAKRISYSKFVDYLQGLTPTGVTITNLQVSEGKMELSAVTSAETQFAQMIENLRKASPEKIYDLQISNVTKGGKTEPRITFTLTTNLGAKAFN